MDDVSLKKYLVENSVFLELSKTDKRDILEDMLLSLAKNNKIAFDDISVLLNSLLEREQRGSTAFGGGFAIPHARHACVTDVFMAVGRSLTGVAWESFDGQPTHCVFLIIAPEFATEKFMKTLSYIARFAKNRPAKTELASCRPKNLF